MQTRSAIITKLFICIILLCIGGIHKFILWNLTQEYEWKVVYLLVSGLFSIPLAIVASNLRGRDYHFTAVKVSLAIFCWIIPCLVWQFGSMGLFTALLAYLPALYEFSPFRLASSLSLLWKEEVSSSTQTATMGGDTKSVNSKPPVETPSKGRVFQMTPPPEATFGSDIPAKKVPKFQGRSILNSWGSCDKEYGHWYEENLPRLSRLTAVHLTTVLSMLEASPDGVSVNDIIHTSGRPIATLRTALKEVRDRYPAADGYGKTLSYLKNDRSLRYMIKAELYR